MPEISKKTEYILQDNYEDRWSDFISEDSPADLVKYAGQRKRAVKNIKQRIIERTTTVETEFLR